MRKYCEDTVHAQKPQNPSHLKTSSYLQVYRTSLGTLLCGKNSNSRIINYVITLNLAHNRPKQFFLYFTRACRKLLNNNKKAACGGSSLAHPQKMWKILFLFVSMQLADSRYEYFIQERKTSSQLMGYLLFITSSINRDQYPSISFANTMGHKCRDVADRVLSGLYDLPVLIWNSDALWDLETMQTQALNVFVNNIGELNQTLLHIKKNRLAYSNDGMLLILLCAKITNITEVEEGMRIIWSYDILNFALIYYITKLEIAQYNPFRNEILNMTLCVMQGCKPLDLLKNLYGYKLQIFVLDDYPSNRYLNGKFVGRDSKFLHRLVNSLNATIEYQTVYDPVESDHILQHRALQSRLVDFSGIGGLMNFNKPWNISYTYPYEMDDVILVLPLREKNDFVNILSIFDKATWGFLFLSFISLSLVMNFCKKALKLPLHWVDTYLELIRLACCKCTTLFGRKPHSIKILIICWILVCVIFDAAIQSAIIGITLVNRRSNDINSLAELKSSKMVIQIRRRHYELYPNDGPIFKQFTAIHKNIIYDNILNSVKIGTALPRSYARDMMEILHANHSENYYVLDEGLIPALYVYSFPIGSPYLPKVNEFIIKDREFGLEKHYVPAENDLPIYHFDESISYMRFNMEHMLFGFFVLLSGHCLGVAIFAGEYFYYEHFAKYKFDFVN